MQRQAEKPYVAAKTADVRLMWRHPVRSAILPEPVHVSLNGA